jgi:hypothetical protein
MNCIEVFNLFGIYCDVRSKEIFVYFHLVTPPPVMDDVNLSQLMTTEWQVVLNTGPVSGLLCASHKPAEERADHDVLKLNMGVTFYY